MVIRPQATQINEQEKVIYDRVYNKNEHNNIFYSILSI